jgi:hypothetical protein
LFDEICLPSFAPALNQIATALSKLLGPQCITNNLVNTGSGPECQVVDKYVMNGKTISSALQSCASNGNTPPCWSLDPDAQKCPGNFFVLNVNRTGIMPPNGLSTAVSCAQCIPGVVQAGCP